MQMIALGFFGVILLGGLLLWLPVCNQKPIAFIDALFTSVSAVCVTGLVTITPATQFTVLGKIILMLLIQTGGLGVMACAISFFIVIRKKITVKERVMIQQAYSLDTLSGMVQFIIRILKCTFLAEGVGALFYMTQFVPRYGLLKGICYGIFHAVSAFCNAGIDILGDNSFCDFTNSPVINITTMGLIVISGLGFMVWHDMHESLKKVLKKDIPRERAFTRLSLSTKVVLTMTVSLILFGAVCIYLMEYNNPETLGGLNWWEKIMAAFFQSVTTRTAGFASISQVGLKQGTKLLCCVLMFIGGSPGGTAGGVKTTTIALMLLICLAVIRGKKDVECYGRRISNGNMRTGIVIVIVTFLFLLFGVTLITILEPNREFIDILYEATSAMGTVGLTADLTPSLTRGSQVVLMALMYIGRIGPITMTLVFAGKAGASQQLRDLPTKSISVG
ncbi:MAG: potassium transporter TrkG [Hespellia sp.]|nr:potassium transporter TrkG [Hespellia sp.]